MSSFQRLTVASSSSAGTLDRAGEIGDRVGLLHEPHLDFLFAVLRPGVVFAVDGPAGTEAASERPHAKGCVVKDEDAGSTRGRTAGGGAARPRFPSRAGILVDHDPVEHHPVEHDPVEYVSVDYVPPFCRNHPESGVRAPNRKRRERPSRPIGRNERSPASQRDSIRPTPSAPQPWLQPCGRSRGSRAPRRPRCAQHRGCRPRIRPRRRAPESDGPS